MNARLSFGLAVAALLFTNWLLFEDILGPLNFLSFVHDRLGAPYWQLLAILGVMVASAVFFPPLNNHVGPSFRLAAFTSSSIVLSVILVGAYAETLRRSAIRAFAADSIEQHSFFRSIREAPRELQFYLHAAALKHCIPYAWSYREMGFYVLRPDVAANVLPDDWIERCAIERGR